MSLIKKEIVIVYDPIAETIQIKQNDFTALEAFGMLEGAKAMIADQWMKIEENTDEVIDPRD
jgi:hypothetical protein